MRSWTDINPKVGAAFLAAVVTFLVSKFQLDVATEALLLSALPVAAAYLWPEGEADELEGIPAHVDESGERDGV